MFYAGGRICCLQLDGKLKTLKIFLCIVLRI